MEYIEVKKLDELQSPFLNVDDDGGYSMGLGLIWIYCATAVLLKLFQWPC